MPREKLFIGKLFDNRKHRAPLYGVPGLHPDFFDLSCNWTANFIFHLHRLDDDEAVTFFDRIAFRNQDGDNLAGHGHAYLLPTLEMKTRLCASDAHPPFIDQMDVIVPAVDEYSILVFGIVNFDLKRAIVNN